jgi:excisionase family DNA binding protein
MVEERKVMDLNEVGRVLGLSKNSVYQAAARGQIPGCFRLGGRYLVKRAVFEEFMRGGRATPSPVGAAVVAAD